MTTVLELVQDALTDIGFTAPSSLLSTNPDSVQLNSILRNQSRHLRNQRVIPTLKHKHSFVTELNRTKYPLPKDFFATIGNTHRDQTNRLELIGPLSDEQFNLWLYQFETNGAPYGYRIFGVDGNPTTDGGQFELIPAPPADLTLSYEYISKNLFTPPYFNIGEVVAINDYRSANGNIYKATSAGTTGSDIPDHITGTESDGTVNWAFINDLYESPLTNNDLSVFDDDIMILGIQWRFLKSKNQDYSTELAEHNALKEKAVTRWTGSFRSSFDGNHRRVSFNIPRGNWSI